MPVTCAHFAINSYKQTVDTSIKSTVNSTTICKKTKRCSFSMTKKY